MRQDIQCLRGIAISLVILYHLYPTLFVNGFLGVDIFFVISGYLMASSLTKTSIGPKQTLIFYYRRFKRILPMYYLVIFVTLVLVHLYLGDFWWSTNRRYALSSLALVTNQLIIHDSADYFREFLADGSSMNCFIHLWSLSVEMQFYLLVPFIFFALQYLKNDLLRLATCILITLFGFIAFAFINPQFSFNFMFLRLWQFSAGFIALYWSKVSFYEYSEKFKPAKIEMVLPVGKDDLVTGALSLISLCLLPNKIEVLLLRPFVTISTAFLIASASQESIILNCKLLAYVGDVSYVIYLVHWPIIAMFVGAPFKCHLFCILITLISSVILHHLYEKQYLKFDIKKIIPLLCILIVSNAYLQKSVRTHSFWNSTYPADVQLIVDKNKMFLPNLWENEPVVDECLETKLPDPIDAYRVFGYCSYPPGKGNLTVMQIGNSYVMNFVEHIRAHFKYNYSEYRYISIGESYGIYAENSGSQLALDISKRHVERYKPDVLLITPRYSPALRTRILSVDTDEYLHQINENIKFYEKHVKKIVILGSHPLYNLNFLNFFLHFFVQRREELESLHLNKAAADDEMRNVKKRFQLAGKNCKKCKFFDMSEVFVEGDKYLTFDRDRLLSYVDNSIHITSAGMKLIEPVLEDVVQDIMNGL